MVVVNNLIFHQLNLQLVFICSLNIHQAFSIIHNTIPLFPYPIINCSYLLMDPIILVCHNAINVSKFFLLTLLAEHSNYCP